jgi:hypothetical protein
VLNHMFVMEDHVLEGKQDRFAAAGLICPSPANIELVPSFESERI